MTKLINLETKTYHLTAMHERAGDKTVNKWYVGMEEALHFAKEHHETNDDQLIMIEVYDPESDFKQFLTESGTFVDFPYYWGLSYPPADIISKMLGKEEPV